MRNGSPCGGPKLETDQTYTTLAGTDSSQLTKEQATKLADEIAKHQVYYYRLRRRLETLGRCTPDELNRTPLLVLYSFPLLYGIMQFVTRLIGADPPQAALNVLLCDRRLRCTMHW